MIDCVDEVKVRYFATYRETGRTCEVDRVMLETPGLIRQWDLNGWTVSTRIECTSVPTFGVIICESVPCYQDVAMLRMQLDQVTAERDEYKARLAGR